jgi:hypothetical protein
VAIEAREMRAEIGEIEITINSPQQMIVRHEFFQVNQFSTFPLNNLPSYHDGPSPVRVELSR